LTPEQRDALRRKFDAEIAERIGKYGWPPTINDQKRLKLSAQAEAELDALRQLQERQSRLREDEEVAERVRDAASYVSRYQDDRFKKLKIEEILEDEEPEDAGEAWDWDPQSRAAQLEQERICIWCGKVQETLELLEKHEAECE
jgi:hypothetical protein